MMRKFFLASLLLLVTAMTAVAQDINPLTHLPGMSNFKNSVKTPSVTPTVTPIEHPIDEHEYITGPGDMFKIVIGNREESTYDNLVINPEGSLLVPSVGSVKVSGLTLAETKQKVREKIATQFLDDSMDIILVNVRSFKVSVTGNVLNPGLVFVTAMDRVSDAISLAGGFKFPEEQKMPETKIQPQQNTQQQQNMAQQQTTNQQNKRTLLTEEYLPPEYPSQRNIQIQRRPDTQLTADYIKYSMTGDLDANPKLLDGDVIFVPSIIKKNLGEISIDGAVKNPVIYEYAPGDRVDDLLKMASGFSVDADSSQIELVRFTSNGRSTQSVYLLMDSPERKKESLNFLLKPDDRLYVQHIPQYHMKRMLEIRGEVMYPNVYPLEGTLRLKDAIEMAGGFTDEAFLENASIIRNATKDEVDPEFERLKTIPVADMTPMEYDYYKVKSRERAGKMSIDFIELFERGDETQNVLLRDRDLIFIPTKKFTVTVSGQVINPGLIPYDENKELDDYIAEAGGYNYNAKKSRVRIIRARTGEWIKPKKEEIQIGDTIFVPEKRDIDWWELTMDIATVGYQLATIYLVISRTQ